MTGWVMHPNNKRFSRVGTNLDNSSESESEIEENKMGEADQRCLTTSFIYLWPLNHHVLIHEPYKILPSRPNITICFPKFTCIEDTYLLLWEFEEICSMMWKHPSWTQISLVSFNWYQLASLYCQYQITKTKWAKLDLLVECTTHLSMINFKLLISQ